MVVKIVVGLPIYIVKQAMDVRQQVAITYLGRYFTYGYGLIRNREHD